MNDVEKLVKAIADAGVPDSVQVGLFRIGGLHRRVADMLVAAVRQKGEAVVFSQLKAAVEFAGRIARAEAYGIPPMAPPSSGDGR